MRISEQSDQIYERPVTPQVARLLGQPAINLIPLRRMDGGWVVDNADRVAVEVPSWAPESERLWLGFRLEAVGVEGGAHEGTIRLVEDTGPATVLVVDWAGQQLRLLVDKVRA